MTRLQQLAVDNAQHSTTPGQSFRDGNEVSMYLDQLIGSEWWAETRLPIIDIQVEVQPSLKKWLGAAVYPNSIVLAPEGLTESTVLHELAHLLTPQHQDHGNEFIEILLKLVREKMGWFAYAEMSQGIEVACAST